MPRPKAASGSLCVMRLTWLIVVGVAVVACKDRQAAKSADRSMRATPGSGSSSAAQQPSPPAPTLQANEVFDQEKTGQDPEWAAWATQAIHAVAPKLELECRHSACRSTLTAPSEAELVAETEQLQAALMTVPEALSVKLSRPDATKPAIVIYVLFDRWVEDSE